MEHVRCKGNRQQIKKPDFAEIKSGTEFNQWYWLKDELIEICRQIDLPYHGGKFELRDRIMYVLDNRGKLKAGVKKKKPKSSFNWAKSRQASKQIYTLNVLPMQFLHKGRFKKQLK
ncbi:MAG: SAP domain-containing protein [Cytophagales bacterium]|nr:SAP domain-containing protein [Cytophagales bacterium]